MDRDVRDARILIVDDEPLVIRAMQRALRSAGFDDLHAVTDSTAALETAVELGPSLILLDLHMPRVDGLDVLGQVRSSGGALVLIPILLMTGDASAEARLKAWELGATDFLNKPIETSELLPRIYNLLRAHALHLDLQSHAEILERTVRERTAELEKAHAEVLVRLALAAEHRDDATGEHTWRVGRISSMLAARLGVEPSRHKLIERAARLHDVGKIGIRDAVLLKPGKLDTDEFEIMKTHTTLGAKLLSQGSSAVLKLAEQVARSHHERWDGSGYPDGLAGTDIPFESRLVAVADVFDALTHLRTYKDSWPVERAIDLIREQSGRQFAPDVADAFIDLAKTGDLEQASRPSNPKFRSILPDPG